MTRWRMDRYFDIMEDFFFFFARVFTYQALVFHLLYSVVTSMQYLNCYIFILHTTRYCIQ